MYNEWSLCKKMWLTAALFLTLFLKTILGHYGPSGTGRIQQLAYNTNHKQGPTKLLKLLNKCLLMVTWERWKLFDSKFRLMAEYSIQSI